MERTLRIEGMHCDACARRVHDALIKVPGVTDAAVDLARKCARVTLSAPVDDAVFRDRIDLLGFTLVSAK